MHPYLPHLLADIKAGHRPGHLAPDEGNPTSVEEVLEESERWATEEPEHTFGHYCGLKPADFPPAEQLSDQDIKLVCAAFRELLCSWNADVSIPDAVPLRIRYQLMRNTLDEGFTVVQSGFITFDYCSGYVPGCPLKEYCPCLEFWNREHNTPA